MKKQILSALTVAACLGALSGAALAQNVAIVKSETDGGQRLVADRDRKRPSRGPGGQ